jgi:glycosyltransferase involved in cell wall biosynthesis
MKFTVTGLDEKDRINSSGEVVDAKGGTEMMKDNLLSRLNPELADKFNFICSRVRELDPNKKNILWCHDTFDDPEAQHLADPDSRGRFEKIVFVSNYQFQTYHMALGVPYNQSIVLKNAIVPIPEHEKPKDGPLRLIYHTTPHRGLELLVPVFEYLWDNGFENKIELDVYSSFNIYGWPWRDEPYEQVFEKCKNHPGINYHGAVSNDEVREALQRAHIFAYPNIWPETSCISAIEAMSAGCAIVAPNMAALPETCGNFAVMYQWDEDMNKHANHFAQLLQTVLNDYWHPSHANKLNFQKIYTDNFYSWDNRIMEWSGLLRSML